MTIFICIDAITLIGIFLCIVHRICAMWKKCFYYRWLNFHLFSCLLLSCASIEKNENLITAHGSMHSSASMIEKFCNSFLYMKYWKLKYLLYFNYSTLLIKIFIKLSSHVKFFPISNSIKIGDENWTMQANWRLINISQRLIAPTFKYTHS